jgi:hypothetical protein
VPHHGNWRRNQEAGGSHARPGASASALDIRVTWTGVEPTDEVESALYSRVLWRLKSSDRWESANILAEGRDRRTARLMPPAWRQRLFRPCRPVSEAHLAPEIPTHFGALYDAVSRDRR